MIFSTTMSIDGPLDDVKGALPRPYLVSRLGLRNYGESEYRYLADGDEDHDFAEAVRFHGQSVLTKTEFVTLVSDCDLHAVSCSSMGTMGGPLGLNIVPDVVFEASSGEDVIFTCRVTPVPFPLGIKLIDEARFERIKNRLLNMFEEGAHHELPAGREYAIQVHKERRAWAAFAQEGWS